MDLRIVERWMNLFLDLLFPRRCPICGEIVVPKGRLVCLECRKKLEFVKEPTCKKCGKEITSNEREYCYDCIRKPHSFERGMAALNYTKLMKDSISRFKYKNKREYADWYSEEILSRYEKQMMAIRPDALIPIPLHISKKRLRGYNQAEVLCYKISRGLGVPMRCDLLFRKRKTAPQKQLGNQARFHNLEQAFSAGRIPFHMKTVILVDDIYTTGSTMEACTRVLKKAGVQKVYILSLCIGKGD